MWRHFLPHCKQSTIGCQVLHAVVCLNQSNRRVEHTLSTEVLGSFVVRYNDNALGWKVGEKIFVYNSYYIIRLYTGIVCETDICNYILYNNIIYVFFRQCQLSIKRTEPSYHFTQNWTSRGTSFRLVNFQFLGCTFKKWLVTRFYLRMI